MLLLQTQPDQTSGEVTFKSKLEEFHYLMKMPKFAKMILYRAEQLKALLKDEITEFSNQSTDCPEMVELPDNILYLDRSKPNNLEDLHLKDLFDYLQTDPEAKTAVVHDWIYVLRPIFLDKMMTDESLS